MSNLNSAQPQPLIANPATPNGTHPASVVVPHATVKHRSPWGVWWLTIITFSVYYFFWYHKINKELAGQLGIKPGARGAWWSQLIPFFNFVGLSRTAKRVNAANIAAKSSARVSPGVAWFWAPAWFISQTRYLQRRINILADMSQ